MTALPFHATPVILNDQVRLRIYRGAYLELDMTLRPRQALVLAGQLLNLTLAADYSTAALRSGPPPGGPGSQQRDRGVLEAPGEQDVAMGNDAHG
jgi:hypothetical protein